MSDLTRREALQVLGGIPLVAAGLSPASVRRAAESVRAGREGGAVFAPKFFTPHELATASLLADLVIPRDERSGSATDAGVPEFMDFILDENPDMRTTFRGGLAWLDRESHRRFGKDFLEAADQDRRRILDDIAWPKKAAPELSHGVAFFNKFRDLTASGFFSSKLGVADLQYQGNEFVMEWKGCPPEALAKLGVKY
jgi:gluconate 2-dehydrogenase subunit 3-like protein